MHLRYLRFLRAMVRWLNSVMVFAMFFAVVALWAVKLRWSDGIRVQPCDP